MDERAFEFGSAVFERGEWANYVRWFRSAPIESLSVLYRNVAEFCFGVSLFQLEQYQESADVLSEVHFSDRFAQAKLASFLGRALLELGRKRKARTLLERSVDLSLTPEGLTFLADAFLRMGQKSKGIATLRRLLREFPDYDEAMGNLAALICQEKPAEAIQLLRKAIDINPHNACAYEQLGLRLCIMDNYDEGMSLLHKALELDRFRARSHGALATEYWRRRDLEKADYHYRQAILCDPTSSSELWMYGQFLEQSGRLTEAEQMMRDAVEINPRDKNAWDCLIKLLRKLNNTAAVDEAIRAVRKHFPEYN